MLQSSVSWLGGLAIKQRNKMSPPENQQPNAHVGANLSHCNLIYVCMHLDLDFCTALRAFLICLVSRVFSGMWADARGVAGLRVGARRICARIWVTSEPSTCFFFHKVQTIHQRSTGVPARGALHLPHEGALQQSRAHHPPRG